MRHSFPKFNQSLAVEEVSPKFTARFHREPLVLDHARTRPRHPAASRLRGRPVLLLSKGMLLQKPSTPPKGEFDQ